MSDITKATALMLIEQVEQAAIEVERKKNMRDRAAQNGRKSMVAMYEQGYIEALERQRKVQYKIIRYLTRGKIPQYVQEVV